MSCPICRKRKAERFCPAKGERICAICCGTYREDRIDCPTHCAHLVAAHRYEDRQRRALPADTPLLEEKIPPDLVHTHQQLMTALAFSIVKSCARQPDAVDTDVLAALQALAATHKTLASGILYEKPPEAARPRELYAALMTFTREVKKQQLERPNPSPLKDLDIFYLSVFLHRMGLLRSNGRPRSRRFIEFLRGQFPPSSELKPEESRIIVP